MHYLCHLINVIGGKASIFPRFDNHIINSLDYGQRLDAPILEKHYLVESLSKNSRFRLNEEWLTPIFSGDITSLSERGDVIVIYSEWTFGNPLKAKRVARWLLHNPGFHRGDSYYTKGEVQFLLHAGFSFLDAPWLRKADFFLHVTYVPFNMYFSSVPVSDPSRDLVTYCRRKGRSKALVHDANSSVCIDNLSHKEISALFKRSKMFISYDPRTFFSNLAVLSGCTSVVVPDSDERGIELARPSIFDSTGIAWGFSDVDRAQAERLAAIDQLRRSSDVSIDSVKKFVDFWQRELGA